jgi:hypothetical protein
LVCGVLAFLAAVAGGGWGAAVCASAPADSSALAAAMVSNVFMECLLWLLQP